MNAAAKSFRLLGLLITLFYTSACFATTPQPGSISGSPVVCQGTNGVSYSVPNVAGTTYAWTFTGTGINNISAVTINSVTINYSNSATSGTLIVTANDGSGVSSPSQLFITVNALPAVPGSITGNSSPCQGVTGIVYSVPNDPFVNYSWSYSGTGLTFQPPVNISAVSASYATNATSGTLTVTATNAGNCSASNTLAINVNAKPATPSTISGLTNPCQGVSNVAYNVTNDPTLSYAWSYTGTGVTFNAPTNLNNVTANYSNSASAGNITVTATNVNGCSSNNTLGINPKARPSTPSVPSGNNNLCQGSVNIVYSVPDDPSVTYAWAYSGIGLSFLTQQDSNKIVGSYSASAASGSLTVTATSINGCASSNSLAITVKTSPAIPSAITGLDTVCARTKGVIYSVVNDPAVTYVWSFDNYNVMFTSPQDSNSIVCDYQQYASSGTLTLTAKIGSCSTASTLPVVVKASPAVFDHINGQDILCPGTYSHYSIYNAQKIPSILYDWGYSGTGATFPAVTDTGSLSVYFQSMATVGTLYAIATDTNGCSITDSLPITFLPTPNIGQIAGTDTLCPGASAQYSVALDTTVTSGYQWSYSGQGASVGFPDVPVKTVTFSSSATSGYLTVSATGNQCTATSSLFITIKPAPPSATIIGNFSPCQGSDYTYQIGYDSAISYSWSYSAGDVTFPANTDTNEVDVHFGYFSSSANLAVLESYVNGCSTLVVAPVTVKNAPVGQISGDTSVCRGSETLLTAPYSGTWSLVDTTIANITTYGSLTALFVGIDTVKFVAVHNGCSLTYDHVVYILDTPSISDLVVPTDKICVGDTMQFADPTEDGVWSSDNPGVATVDSNGNVVTHINGYAKITYTVTNAAGCKSKRTERIGADFHNNPHIGITPPASICRGTLMQNFSGSVDRANVPYFWVVASGNASIEKGDSTRYCTVSFDTPGDVTIALVASTDGCSDSAKFTVHVSDDSALRPVVIYAGQRFVCLQNNVKTYQWGYDDIANYIEDTIKGATNQDYFLIAPDLQNKQYWVLTTNSNGDCPQKTYYDPAKDHALKQVRNSNLVLIPNPASDYVRIDASAVANDVAGLSLEITDMAGKQRLACKMEALVQQTDIKMLMPGSYIVNCYRYGKKLASGGLIKN